MSKKKRKAKKAAKLKKREKKKKIPDSTPPEIQKLEKIVDILNTLKKFRIPKWLVKIMIHWVCGKK